jgi:hypothetical protein
MQPPTSDAGPSKTKRQGIVNELHELFFYESDLWGKAKSAEDNNIFKALAIVVVPDGVLFDTVSVAAQ